MISVFRHCELETPGVAFPDHKSLGFSKKYLGYAPVTHVRGLFEVDVV